MMSSGSTTFFFDFDIFSIEPIVDRLAGGNLDGAAARRPRPRPDLGRQQPVAVVATVGLVRDHALREQAANGSREFCEPWPVSRHGAGKEAGIEQVQDRVLDAADILVDGSQ